MGELGDFLTEGLRRYPEAVTTVRFFEDQIQKKLEAAAQGEFWRRFVPTGADSLKRPAGAEGEECWIYAMVNGQVDAAVFKLEYGLWWNVPKIDAPVIAYANFWEPAELRAYEFRPTRSGVRIQRTKGRQRLYVPVAGAADIEEALETVLGELEDAAITCAAQRGSDQKLSTPRPK